MAPEAVLLDRDGTINVKPADGEYVERPDQLELLPGAGEAIAALNRRRIPVAVVTNQRGIALGRMTEGDLEAIHRRLRELLAREGAFLGPILHCPHDIGVCGCRKPGTLLLEWARDELGLSDLGDTVVIGDSASDVLAGLAAGARTVLITAGSDAVAPADATAPSLLDAVAQTFTPR